MRSIQLQPALTEFLQDASACLNADVSAGAEVSFELESQGGHRGPRGASLYCYRALTGEFIAERQRELERLPSYGDAARQLESFDGLGRYLASMGADVIAGDAHKRARVAIGMLLRDVFDEQAEFELRPERLSAAFERLERSALAGTDETTVVATLHGLTISSAELPLTVGLTIAQPHALEGLPDGALASDDGSTAGGHLVVALTAAEVDPHEAVIRGRAVLTDLLRALRLFGDGRVTLGALAWARVGRGTWKPLALGTGGRPHGMLVVTVEQEDELRAFCNLVSRRAPDGNELAWALRRFELGCERDSPFEALTDHMLALRALLEPEGPSSGLLAGRLAALCATPQRRAELTERVVRALALERDVIRGTAAPHTGAQTLAKDFADHLRALLRDVICGHLEPDLATIADELLLESERKPEDFATTDEKSVEQVFGDPAEAFEVLDVFI
jgi:hypothetical protein